MKIRNEKNKIIIEYDDEEKKIIGNNMMLLGLNSDCICLMSREGLKQVSADLVKCVLVDDNRLMELVKEILPVVSDGKVIGQGIPLFKEEKDNGEIKGCQKWDKDVEEFRYVAEVEE